jgi:hypothetical protein
MGKKQGTRFSLVRQTRNKVFPCLSNKEQHVPLFLVPCFKAQNLVFRSLVFLQIITHDHGIEYDPNLHWYWPDYYKSGGD